MALANLTVIGVAGGLALMVGDRLLTLLSGGRMPVVSGLLACLMLLLVTHSLRRVLELVAYLRGASGRFVIASSVGLCAPGAVILALALWPVPQAAVVAAFGVDALLILVALALLQRAGVPMLSRRS